MLNPEQFLKLINDNSIDFFTGVPDSLLKPVCACITDRVTSSNHIIAANEGGAVGLALGHYLATGKPALVYLQNSGQGNTINPLLSLADPKVYGIPMLLLVGWRGEPGKKDEPQHVKQGEVMTDIFDACDIPYAVLPTDEGEASELIESLTKRSVVENQPVALIVPKGAFEEYTLPPSPPSSYTLAREEAIALVAEAMDSTDAVVSTTGMISRELYEYRDRKNEGHHRDFLTVGGMGHASQIALGLALAKPERRVWCLDGDGASLMHLGGMGIVANATAPNFRHILINNGAHDSVGGQPTIGFNVDFCDTAKGLGYQNRKQVVSAEELKAALPQFMKESGPSFLEIRVAKGARKDLGRPKTTPEQNKLAFMEFLNHE